MATKKTTIAVSRAPEPAVIETAFEWPELDLPSGAEALHDGTVALELDTPCMLRGAGGDEVIARLVFRRLTGRDMRVVLAAKDGTKAMLARAIGWSPARLALLYGKMDASDVTAASKVVAEMADFGEGMPDRAEKRDDGTVVLPLLQPVDGDDGPVFELVFHRLTGADLDALKRTTGVQTTLTLIARSLRKKTQDFDAMFDGMDGADIVAAQRVAGFLSGSGRLTGR